MKIRIVLLVLIYTTALFAQKNQIKKATNQYNNFAYIDAIKIYERVANKGYESAAIYKKLANAYYFNTELEKAAKWYEKLIDLNQKMEPEYYFRYSQTLKAVEKYDKANEMLEKFNQLKTNDTRGQKYIETKDYLETIEENSGRYTIENAGIINSKYSDYGATVFNENLVFTSAKDTGTFVNRKHKWTNQSFTNLYEYNLKKDSLEQPKRFSKTINSKFHESSPIFTKDGKTMYFTRNNYTNKKIKKNKNRIILLKLYKASLVDNKWTNETELPFNSNEYSVAHPALSTDEKTLYFASDMPGTLGLSDLYKVSIDGEKYGKPQNLGAAINTEARETFPFISAENELYFASDGQLGLGGLDIFVSKTEEDGTFKKVYNLGKPINSKNDDFAFYINTQTKEGFFSSNREEGQGYDDIYKCKEKRALLYKCEQTLKGVVIDEETKTPISNAQLILLDENGQKTDKKQTDENGKFSFIIECNKEYTIKIATIEGYLPTEKIIYSDSNAEKITIEIPIKKQLNKIEKNTDLAKIFEIETIYFDLDKAYITKDAAAQLAIILEVMNEYPTIKIDVRSHTDCRQTYNYNMILSEKRAKSTINWLIENGIAKNRLTGKGYGESTLINNCDCEPTNNSPCSEEEHQQNRRSEFVILEI